MAVFGGWRLTRTGILFFIGVLVLVGLVTGGIFLVKNHGEAVRRDEAVKVAEQKLKDESQVVSEPIATDTPEESGAAGADTSNNGESVVVTPSDTSELPQTGPVDGLVNVIIVAMLALSVAFYVSSRRAGQHL